MGCCCCIEPSSNENPAFILLYRWGIRHLALEIVMALASIVMSNFYPLAGSLVSLCAILSAFIVSIPCCCCLTTFGWKLNMILQSVLLFFRTLVLIFICLLTGRNSVAISMYYILALLISSASAVHLIYFTQRNLLPLAIVPVNMERDYMGVHAENQVYHVDSAPVPTVAVAVNNPPSYLVEASPIPIPLFEQEATPDRQFGTSQRQSSNRLLNNNNYNVNNGANSSLNNSNNISMGYSPGTNLDYNWNTDVSASAIDSTSATAFKIPPQPSRYSGFDSA